MNSPPVGCGANPLDSGLEYFHHLISTFSIILVATSYNELNDWHGAPAGANPLGSGLSWYKGGKGIFSIIIR